MSPDAPQSDDDIAFADVAPGFVAGHATPDPAKVIAASKDGDDDLTFTDEVGVKPGARPAPPPAAPKAEKPPAPAPVVAPPSARASDSGPQAKVRPGGSSDRIGTSSDRFRALERGGGTGGALEPPGRGGKLGRTSSGSFAAVGTESSGRLEAAGSGRAARAKKEEPQYEVVKPGAVLGEWTVGAALGDEDGVRVFKATRNGKEAVLREHVLPTLAAADLVSRAERLGQVFHDDLEPLLGSGRSRGGAWYVVEPRTSVERGISAAKAPLREAEALAMVRGAARVLAVLAQRSIVHGDPSPRNLFLEGNGNVRLGSPVRGARSLHGLAAGPVVGDPRYAAPEVLDGQAPSGASDVFTLGLSLSFLVSGQEPAGGDDAFAVFLARSRGLPELARVAPSSSEGARALASRMTAPDPAQRPTAAEVVAMVDDLLNSGRSPAAASPRATVALERALVPRGIAIALAVVAVLALGGALALIARTSVADPTASFRFEVDPSGK